MIVNFVLIIRAVGRTMGASASGRRSMFRMRKVRVGGCVHAVAWRGVGMIPMVEDEEGVWLT